MKKFILIALLLINANKIYAVDFIPYVSSMKYSDKVSRTTAMAGFEFFAKVYKNLSAGFGVAYVATELGSVSQQLQDLGINIDDKELVNISSFPVYFTTKYQHVINDSWSLVGIGKIGIAGGSNTYYTQPNNDYEATIVSKAIYGGDVGIIYKNLLATINYHFLRLDNHYEDRKNGVFYTNGGNITYIGVKFGYIFSK
jgi:hypothetical protein